MPDAGQVWRTGWQAVVSSSATSSAVARRPIWILAMVQIVPEEPEASLNRQ